MNPVLAHLDLLGLRVVDVITGFVGVPASIVFEVSGAIQAVVTPLVDEKGLVQKGHWFDVKRLRGCTLDKNGKRLDVDCGGQRLMPNPADVFTEGRVRSELVWLGQHVRSKATFLEGICTNVSFDLYGCVSAIVAPPAKDGVQSAGEWVATNLLEVASEVKITPPQFFAVKVGREPGPCDKGMPPRDPLP